MPSPRSSNLPQKLIPALWANGTQFRLTAVWPPNQWFYLQGVKRASPSTEKKMVEMWLLRCPCLRYQSSLVLDVCCKMRSGRVIVSRSLISCPVYFNSWTRQLRNWRRRWILHHIMIMSMMLIRCARMKIHRTWCLLSYHDNKHQELTLIILSAGLIVRLIRSILVDCVSLTLKFKFRV